MESTTAALAASEVEAGAQLAYDPSDPDKMKLPVGTTCGDCVHIRRCTMIFGHTASDKFCDWSPSRFRPAAKAAGSTV